jgi:hypothetical protein
MLPLLAVLAAAHAIDVPQTLAPTLPAVKARTRLAVLLPETMPAEQAVLYPSGTARRRSYALGLDAVPHCGGANACFEAAFWASARGRPSGRRVVRLARGRTGRFTPLSCGGSCAPPSISWRERGATYWMQARVGTRRTERRILVRMANTANRSGPR